MTQRVLTLDPQESAQIIEEVTTETSALVIETDPGGPRGAGSADPPLQSYDLKVEKEKNGSWTEVERSPVSYSSNKSKENSTVELGSRMRVTITNTGNTRGVIEVSVIPAEDQRAIKGIGGGNVISKGVKFPARTSDPSDPDEGQAWLRTDL